jgi:hypothetical protein
MRRTVIAGIGLMTLELLRVPAAGAQTVTETATETDTATETVTETETETATETETVTATEAEAVTVSAAVGAGSYGRDVATGIELGAAYAGETLAVGLRGRALMVGDHFRREDWDETGDWIALLHHLEWRIGFDDDAADDSPWRRPAGLAVAAGQLSSIDIGSIAEGYTAGIDADGRHAGVHARLDAGAFRGELAVDDVADPALIAGRLRRVRGPLAVGVQGGLDPSAPHAMTESVFASTAVDAALAARHGIVLSTIDAGVGLAPGLGGGVWIGGGAAIATDRIRSALRVEGTAGTGGWVPAPFGPLYRVLRADAGGRFMSDTDVPLRTRASAGELGGVGGAVSARLDLRGLGAAEAAMRYRPGLGGEARGRVEVAAIGPVRGGAWLAAAPRLDTWAAAGELRALVGRFDLGLEAARLYETGRPDAMDEGLDAPSAVWQVTAWLGVRAGP